MPGYLSIAIILLLRLQEACQAETCTLSQLRKIKFIKCQDGMVNTFGFISDLLPVNSSRQCAALCYMDSECLTFNLKVSATNVLECQLSNKVTYCPDLSQSTPGTSTYIKETLFGLSESLELFCEKGMPDVPNWSTFNYPMAYVDSQTGYPHIIVSSESAPSERWMLCNNGWLILQSRRYGDVDFYREWADYKKGFGSFDGDHWAGLDTVHYLTSTASCELFVPLEMTLIASDTLTDVYVSYDTFNVGSEADNYRLTVGDYSAGFGDSLSPNNGYQFSTKDNDNSGAGLAEYYQGGWWYSPNNQANLNGIWEDEGETGAHMYDHTDWSGARRTHIWVRRKDY